MRDVTIGGLSALDSVRPRTAAKAKSARPGRQGRGSRFRRFRAKAALIVGSAGFSAIMIGIVLNAVVMQKGHHPAPLFASPTPVPATQRPAEVVPLPPLPPAASLPPASAVPDAPVTAAPIVPTAAPPKAQRGKGEDPITRLLEGTGAVPPASAAPVHAAPVHKVVPVKVTHQAAAMGTARSIPVAREKLAVPAAAN